MTWVIIILGRRWLVTQRGTDKVLGLQREAREQCQFSQNARWYLMWTLQHSLQEGKGAGGGNWGLHKGNRIARSGRGKKKRQCIWKRRLGPLLGGSCRSKLEVLGIWNDSFYHGLIWPFRSVWRCCPLAAPLSVLPSLGIHRVLHFLALWWAFPAPFRLLFLHSSYICLSFPKFYHVS